METKELWEDYKNTGSIDIRNKLVENYMGLVELTANRVGNSIGWKVDKEELVSYGVEGLMDSIEKYDLTKDNKFETYASIRIWGQILDGIRKADWVPRSTRKKNKDMQFVVTKLGNKLCRTPTNTEIAKELKLSKEEFEELIKETNLQTMTSLEMLTGHKEWETTLEEGNPDSMFAKKELKEVLATAIENLKDTEQKVISLYYTEDLTLREIGEVLDISESRVHQIRKQALGKLRKILVRISYGT